MLFKSNLKNLVLVKLGGSLITDKSQPYIVRSDVIRRLCQEIHDARQTQKFPLLIGHGGGSFPHVSAKKYETHKGIIHEKSWEGFVKVQEDAAKLNRIIVSSLMEAGEWPIAMQPSASCIARNGRIVRWDEQAIRLALAGGLLPVPYGDVCFDLKNGCCIISTEEILRFLCKKLRPARIIMAGKTDGVLDQNGQVIPSITRKNFRSIRWLLSGSDGVADVTGGMAAKVKTSLEFNVDTQIINGLTPDTLKRALLGDQGLGTMIRR